jgi:hypothetical protein
MPWWNHQHALQDYYHEAGRHCGGPSSSNLAYDNTLGTHRPLAQHANVLYGMTSIRLESPTKKLGARPATHRSGRFLHVWYPYWCKVLWPTVLRQLLRKKSARSSCWCSLDDWLQSIAIMGTLRPSLDWSSEQRNRGSRIKTSPPWNFHWV